MKGTPYILFIFNRNLIIENWDLQAASAVDLTNDSVNHSTASAKFRNKVLKKIRFTWFIAKPYEKQYTCFISCN